MKTLDELKLIKKQFEKEWFERYALNGMDIGNKLIDNQRTSELSIRLFVDGKKKYEEPNEDMIPPTVYLEEPDRRNSKYQEGLEIIEKEDLSEKKEDQVTGKPRLFYRASQGIRKKFKDVGCYLSDDAMYIGIPKESGTKEWHFIDGMKAYRLKLKEEDGKYYVHEAVKTDVIQYKFMPLEGKKETEIEKYKGKYKGGEPKETAIKGTLGAVVESKSKDSDFTGFLTCNHVLDDIPTGYEKYIRRAKSTKNTDYAAIDIEGYLGAAKASAKKGYAAEVEKIGRIRDAMEPRLGVEVRKYGSKTGLTYGRIASVDLTAKIYKAGSDGGKSDGEIYEGQIGIVADLTRNWIFGHNGDSGSLVVNNTLNAIGLLIACNNEDGINIANRNKEEIGRNAEGIFCVATPIQEVLDDLEVVFCNEKLTNIARDIDNTMKSLVLYPPPLSENDPLYAFIAGHGIPDTCNPCCCC